MLVHIGQYALVDGTPKGGRSILWTEGSDDWVVDVIQPARAAGIKTKLRGLHSASVSFDVKRTFDTYDEAHLFRLQHVKQIPRTGVDGVTPPLVTFTYDLEKGGKQTLFLRDAALKSVRFLRQIGVHVEHSYTFIGGYFETTPS